MYLEAIEIVFIQPCLADANKIRFKAGFSRDIAGMLPYLNAVMPNATYNHEGQVLTFVREGRLFTLYPRELAVAKAANTTDAYRLIDWLKDLINATYERRDELKPDYSLRSRPKPLEIYGWLPRTNCRKCGELTCLAFAARLLLGEQRIERCAPLFTAEYAHLKEPLLEIVAALGL